MEGKINYQEVVAANDFITSISDSMLTRVTNNSNTIMERTALVYDSKVAETMIAGRISIVHEQIKALVNDVAELSKFISTTVPASYQNVEEEIRQMFVYEVGDGALANINSAGNYPQ